MLRSTHLIVLLIMLLFAFSKKKAECEAEADLDEGGDSTEGIRIKAHHITKIAAELLLDL